MLPMAKWHIAISFRLINYLALPCQVMVQLIVDINPDLHICGRSPHAIFTDLCKIQLIIGQT